MWGEDMNADSKNLDYVRVANAEGERTAVGSLNLDALLALLLTDSRRADSRNTEFSERWGERRTLC